MGFYGNVTNTSKTTFSFDLVYDTRLAMDKNADTDGVFLGRYVLIDYDDSPIKGYAKKKEDGSVEGFYNTANFSASSIINPRPDIIYQDLHNAMDALSFYKWDASQSRFVLIQAGTPYQSRFQEDVKEYGRAYDSTVWVKRYDTTTERYKYAMIAELNAVVPTLHMIVDKPTSVPTTPYFDRDTTNIDYYLHMQSNYGMHIRAKNNGVDATEYSDEKVQNVPVYWKVDNNGYQYPETGNPVEVDADIFYNNKGFDHAVRTFIDKEGYNKNVINYSMAQSGRKYGRDADQGAYTYGDPADDVYEWYIRLPGIGNAISNMWDKVYDDRGNNQKRALNKALKRQDTDNHLVSYDKNTVIGMMNTTQDLLGYHFIPTDDTYKAGYEVTGDGSTTITIPLKGENGVADYDATYRLIDCLFYDKPAEDNRAVTQYYHFAYTPTYTPFEGEELEEGKVYYHLVDGVWEVANNTLYKATDSNGNVLNTMAIGDYCTKVNKWTLVALEPQLEDNIYSLIRLIHDIIGTDEDDVRSLDTMKGTINHIKDIIANIDTSLYPGCLLVTDPVTGVIKTSETRFPAADWDKDELLAGDGQWVSRYASVKVRENSDNANRKIPKVVEFETTSETAGSAPVKLANAQQKQEINENGELVFNEDGTPKMIDIELISDNQRDKNGTTLVYKQEHDPNTLIFATRDKWIKLHPDAADDSIEFEHTQSPIVHRLSYQVLTDPDDITIITGPADDDNSAVNTANFKANEDGTEITLVPDSDNSIIYNDTDLENNDDSNADTNDNRLTIPYITVDNAGHVIAASTKNYNIPHGFKKISTYSLDDTNESESQDIPGISIAETISDTLQLAPQNRWIDIATVENNKVEGSEQDVITFGHRLVPALNTSVVLNGERRTSKDEIPTVYRYGLPADKDIKTLDNKNVNEKTNTFNVPYIEVDKAGHIVAAETHTVELPENFTTVTLQPQNESTLQEADTVVVEVKLAADTLTDNLTLKTVNRWIGLGLTDTENDDTITFGHRLSDIKDVTPLELNGERRADEKYSKVYRYGLPQNKTVAILDAENGVEAANTFNVPYVEIDEAGHVVYAETNVVTLPENFTTVTLNPQDESSVIEANTVTEQKILEADTLTDNLTFTTVNRWIGLGLNPDNDEITFGHRLSDIKDVEPLELNGERRADAKYENVYRYGLPQNKTITILDSENGIEAANTFNVPYVEIDEAGHIVHAETHTVQLPEGYTTINIGVPKSDDLTSDELAGEATVTADTLTESLTINPSNKWIRLNAENTAGSDTITIGHEIHAITSTTSSKDLDGDTQESAFTTQTVIWDEAGHIIGEDTKTWTLPDSFHNIKVIGESKSVNNGNLKDGDIAADETFDTLTFEPSNQWIRLSGNEETDVIQIGHLTQGTAGAYTGTDLDFTEFGGTVTIYGYETDNAGHIISNPTYTLTLPKGSYKEDENNNANVLTSLSFTDTTGALVGSKTNIGNLLLMDYTTENITSAAVVATDSLNTAIAKIEAQIKAEAVSRELAITMEQTARAAAAETLQQNIDKETENRETAIDSLNEKIDQEIEDRQTAVTEEATLREQADNAEVTARDTAIAAAVQAVWNDLLANYNLVLTPPTISSISKTAIDANYSVQLVANIVAIESDTYSYSWSTGETGNTIEVTQAGTYTCTVTRTHNGYTSTATKSIDVLESEIPVPEVEEEETPTV